MDSFYHIWIQKQRLVTDFTHIGTGVNCATHCKCHRIYVSKANWKRDRFDLKEKLSSFAYTSTSPNDTTPRNTSFDCLFSVLFDYYNITDLPDFVEPTWTFSAVINAIVAPPVTVINFLIIWTILSDKELREDTHNILLAALALTDSEYRILR